MLQAEKNFNEIFHFRLRKKEKPLKITLGNNRRTFSHERHENLGNKMLPLLTSRRTRGKFRKINIRIREINVPYSMGEVIFSRLYRIRAFLRIRAASPCNINVTRTMEPENSWLYSDILVDERCSICRLQPAVIPYARERREGAGKSSKSPSESEIPSSPKPTTLKRSRRPVPSPSRPILAARKSN